MSAKLPERTYWSVNAHGHMEISGVYVEALESAYAKAVEALSAIANSDYRGNRSSESQSAFAALRSLPKVPV